MANKPPHAVRGNRVLNQDELRPHLIQVFGLERVGVLLRAAPNEGRLLVNLGPRRGDCHSIADHSRNGPHPTESTPTSPTWRWS
jgi:hypothetical protein